jgi:hypothetical protein
MAVPIPNTGSVYATLGTPATQLQTPQDWQRQAVDAEKLRQEQQQMKQDAADEQAYRRILQETGGDPEQMVKRLRVVAPARAIVFEQEWGKAREQLGKAHNEELRADLAEGEHGLALLRAVTDDASYQRMRPIIAKYLPEMAQILPETYDPRIIAEMMDYGETSSENLKRNLDSYKFHAEGKPMMGAAMAMSTATNEQEWEETRNGQLALGVPRAIMDTFGAWRPGAQKRAEQLAMTANERADNVREDAKAQEDIRYHDQQIAATERGQDIGATTAARGQDIGAATAARGQDIGAATAARGQDIGAATARRGQDLDVKKGTGGRGVISGDARKFAAFKDSRALLGNLRQMLKDTKGSTGTGAAIGASLWNPITDATGIGMAPKKRQAAIDLAKQIIGKTLEEGVLRKEDEYKYTKILPTMSDPEEVAQSKIDGLEIVINEREESLTDSLGDAGYDVSAYRTRQGTSAAPAPPAAPAGNPYRKQ